MCDCIILGIIKILNGILFIGDQRIDNVPDDLLSELKNGEIEYSYTKDSTLIINNYEYKNNKFRKTFRALIKNKYRRFIKWIKN